MACDVHSSLIRLRDGITIRLKPDTAMIGHDGWADARAGRGSETLVRMNDFNFIQDLSGLEDVELYAKLRALGDESARVVTNMLGSAVEVADHVIVATHVPPFEKAVRYRGKQSGPEFTPHFCNVGLGRAILAFAKSDPFKNFTVLCGHTHCQCDYRAADNVFVKVAGATYGQPAIADILHL